MQTNPTATNLSPSQKLNNILVLVRYPTLAQINSKVTSAAIWRVHLVGTSGATAAGTIENRIDSLFVNIP